MFDMANIGVENGMAKTNTCTAPDRLLKSLKMLMNMGISASMVMGKVMDCAAL
jgi:hypothetical protein